VSAGSDAEKGSQPENYFLLCRHSRENGNPAIVKVTLDARFRGHDELYFVGRLVSGLSAF
jgi:hypothetical protein